MGCTEEAIENKKPLLPAKWESFKNIWERGPIRSGKHALIHIQHTGLFWLIIRLLLGFQPPQTKTQHRGRTSSLQGGESLRWAAIYWMLFVLNWCNCFQLQLQHFPSSGAILERAQLKHNDPGCKNISIRAHLGFFWMFWKIISMPAY